MWGHIVRLSHMLSLWITQLQDTRSDLPALVVKLTIMEVLASIWICD